MNANDNLLTIQQQLERLQREVIDISKLIYSEDNEKSNNKDFVSNLSAIDMRIYDLEKDVKNLTLNIEEIFFQVQDLSDKLTSYENVINDLNSKLVNIHNQSQILKNDEVTSENMSEENSDNSDKEKEENTLGSLKITKSNDSDNSQSQNNETDTLISKKELSVEDQFQLAFDNIRNKKWEDAKLSLNEFIENNKENQLSGSAHYWLGELHILEKKYRDAALIFAEGYQKYPKSIKAPDMLYKLAISLFEVKKIEEGCNTIQKFLNDYPTHKLYKKSNKLNSENNCTSLIQ